MQLRTDGDCYAHHPNSTGCPESDLPASADGSRSTKHRRHPLRRPWLRGPRVLRTPPHQDSESRQTRRGRDQTHGLLFGSTSVLAIASWSAHRDGAQIEPEYSTGSQRRARSRGRMHGNRFICGVMKSPSRNSLKEAGYATCMSGKWHCNSRFNNAEQPQPGDAGFDHWFGTQNNAAPSHQNPKNYVRNGKRVGPLEGYSCQLAVDEVPSMAESTERQNETFLRLSRVPRTARACGFTGRTRRRVSRRCEERG